MTSQATIKPSKWLMQLSKRARKWTTLTISLGLINGLLLILQASVLAHLVSAIYIHHAKPHTILLFITALLGLFLVRALLAFGREACGFNASATVRSTLRHELIDGVFNLSPLQTQRYNAASMSTQVFEQIESLHGFFAYYLPQMALAVTLPFAILAFVFPISWVAGLLLLITAPLIPVFMALVGMGAESIHQRHLQSLAKMSAHFLDTLQGLISLKLFNRSREQVDVIASVSDNYRQKTMAVLRVAFLSSALLELFSSLAIAMLAVYLGMCLLGHFNFGHYHHALTLGGAFFVLLLAPDFFMNLRELATHYHARAEAIGAAKEICPLLQQTETPTVHYTHFPNTREIAIECNHVCVQYPDRNQPALLDCSLQLAAGQHLTITGPSGIGKTTLLNVLLKFIEPSSGHVFINGIDLTKIDPTVWYQHIGWLNQKPQLFYGSLRDNILMANPSASPKALASAIELSQANEFLTELPNGLDTLVGEQGFGLSGGQAQRIALARMILKRQPIAAI